MFFEKSKDKINIYLYDTPIPLQKEWMEDLD